MISDFYSEHVVRGRRPYYCPHCKKAILMGARHVHVSSCSSGKLHSHRAHLACHEAATGKSVNHDARREAPVA